MHFISPMTSERGIALILTALLVAPGACGFKPRGAAIPPGTGIVIESPSGNMTSATLKILLPRAGGRAVESLSNADYRLVINDEIFDKRVLSVSPTTGKVVEYEVTLSVVFTLFDDGSQALLSDIVSASGDYTFDSAAVLGKHLEETELKNALATRVATSMIRRLQAIIR